MSFFFPVVIAFLSVKDGLWFICVYKDWGSVGGEGDRAAKAAKNKKIKDYRSGRNGYDVSEIQDFGLKTRSLWEEWEKW